AARAAPTATKSVAPRSPSSIPAQTLSFAYVSLQHILLTPPPIVKYSIRVPAHLQFSLDIHTLRESAQRTEFHIRSLVTDESRRVSRPASSAPLVMTAIPAHLVV